MGWVGVLLISLSAGMLACVRALPEARPEGPFVGGDPSLRFDYDPGANYGLNISAEISQTTIMTTLRGAEQGNKESLYFLGLMRLYGHGLPKDEARAAEAFRVSAEKGHLEAQTALGMMLYQGQHLGLGRDLRAAEAYWRQAASQGHAEAQWLLGRMYYEGKTGISGEANASLALPWFRASAEQGNANGQYYMGLVSEYGLGVVEQDFGQAVTWYELASVQGHLDATYNLGLMRAYGRGCAQDWQRALLLFQKAAGQGHGPSMYYVGVMHVYGHGVPVSYDRALTWFDRAAAANDFRVSGRAAEAGAELSTSLQRAREANQERQDHYYRQQLDDYRAHARTTTGDEAGGAAGSPQQRQYGLEL